MAAGGSSSTDRSQYAPSVPPLPRSDAFSLAPASYKGVESSGSSSEKTPLYPQVAKLSEGAIQGQEYRSYQDYGAVEERRQPTTPAYGIPVWQNQPMWSTGLFDCCADVPMCFLTMILPCFAFGRNAEALDEGKNSCLTAALVWWVLQQTTLLGCIYSSGYRAKLRSKYNIPEGPLPDWVIHLVCWPCAFCQEYREIHFRTFEPESWGCCKTFMVPPSQQGFQSYQSR